MMAGTDLRIDAGGIARYWHGTWRRSDPPSQGQATRVRGGLRTHSQATSGRELLRCHHDDGTWRSEGCQRSSVGNSKPSISGIIRSSRIRFGGGLLANQSSPVQPPDAPAAARLNGGKAVIADQLRDLTIQLADIVGLTRTASKLASADLVCMLNGLISEFDRPAIPHGVEKIKTVGDNYMLPGACPSCVPTMLSPWRK
jgi:hypothetical protein